MGKKGKVLNPADHFRRQQRQREKEKNKDNRSKTREVTLKRKDPLKLKEELQRYTELDQQGKLDKNGREKRRQLEDSLTKLLEHRKLQGLETDLDKLKQERDTSLAAASLRESAKARGPWRRARAPARARKPSTWILTGVLHQPEEEESDEESGEEDIPLPDEEPQEEEDIPLPDEDDLPDLPSSPPPPPPPTEHASGGAPAAAPPYAAGLPQRPLPGLAQYGGGFMPPPPPPPPLPGLPVFRPSLAGYPAGGLGLLPNPYGGFPPGTPPPPPPPPLVGGQYGFPAHMMRPPFPVPTPAAASYTYHDSPAADSVPRNPSVPTAAGATLSSAPQIKQSMQVTSLVPSSLLSKRHAPALNRPGPAKRRADVAAPTPQPTLAPSDAGASKAAAPAAAAPVAGASKSNKKNDAYDAFMQEIRDLVQDDA